MLSASFLLLADDGWQFKSDLYGFLIGSWELDVVAHDDNGNVTHSTGEAHAAWILEGRAVQDVFVNPRIGLLSYRHSEA